MSTLEKSLDLKDLTLFGISSILGSGGFNLIGKAVRAGGSMWPVFFSLSAVVLLGSAWSYTRAFQVSRKNTSESDVIRQVFGSTMENTGAAAILVTNIVSIAVILVLVSQLLLPDGGWWMQIGCSTLLLSGMTAFSLFGIDVNKDTINWFTWALIIMLTAAMGLGGWGAMLGRSIRITDPLEQGGTKSIMYFFFILAGFDMLMKFAEESVNPDRDLPLVFFGTNIVSDVLVLGVAAALAMWVPGLSEAQENNAIGHLFARFLGPTAIVGTELIMVIFMLVTTFVVFLGTTRYLFGLSEQRESLKWLRSLNRAKVPWVAVAVVFGFGVLCLLLNHIDLLVRIANGGFLVTLGLVSAAMTTIDWNAGSLVSTAVHALTAAGMGGILVTAFL